MVSRIVGVVLLVIGVATAGLAVATATVWKSADSVTATANLGKSPAPVVMSAPGFLDVAGTPVTITAKSSDPKQKVVLAVGHSNEVSAWVGKTEHVTMDSLSSWSTIHTKTTKGDATAVDPAGSDLWLAESDGTGSAKLTWKVDGGQYSLLAATDGTKPAPATISVTWPRSANVSLLVPGIVVGLLLAAAGGFLLLRKHTPVPAEVPSVPVEEGRRARRLARATAAGDGHRSHGGQRSGDSGGVAPPPGESPSANDVRVNSVTGDVPSTAEDSRPAQPMTRREARLARAAKADAAQAPEAGTAPDAAQMPDAARNEEAEATTMIDMSADDDHSAGGHPPASADRSTTVPLQPKEGSRFGRRRRHASAETPDAGEADEPATEIRPSTGMHRAIKRPADAASASAREPGPATGMHRAIASPSEVAHAPAEEPGAGQDGAAGAHPGGAHAGGAPVFDWPSLRSVQGEGGAAPQPRSGDPQAEDQRAAAERWRAAWGVSASDSTPPPDGASEERESGNDEGGQR